MKQPRLLVEKVVIQKMLSLVGFENGDGTFVTGGSNANYIALLCARNQIQPTIKLAVRPF